MSIFKWLPCFIINYWFSVILRYCWYFMSSGFFWYWSETNTGLTSLYTFFNHVHVLWGICERVGGWKLPVLLPPLAVNTTFLQIGFGVGVWVFLIYPYVFFGCWFWWYGHWLLIHPRRWMGNIFLFFTLLVYVSVVSSLVFQWFFLGICLPFF